MWFNKNIESSHDAKLLNSYHTKFMGLKIMAFRTSLGLGNLKKTKQNIPSSVADPDPAKNEGGDE